MTPFSFWFSAILNGAGWAMVHPEQPASVGCALLGVVVIIMVDQLCTAIRARR